MSERDELEERLAVAQTAFDGTQEELDQAAADLSAYNAANPGSEDTDRTEPPA